MKINNKDIGWGIAFGVFLGQIGGWWAIPIAVGIFVVCAYIDWLLEPDGNSRL